MGIECGGKRDAAEVRMLSGCESGSELLPPGRSEGLQGGEETCAARSRLVTRHMWAGHAAKRAKFSTWDIDFMLRR